MNLTRDEFVNMTIGKHVLSTPTVDQTQIAARVETARDAFDYLTKKYSDHKKRDSNETDRNGVEKMQGVRSVIQSNGN